MDILDVIRRHLDSIRDGRHLWPPTLIFEEGWLLRWVLSLASEGSLPRKPDERATWFSEAQLYTAFGAGKGREFSESHTRADATLGHIAVGGDSKTGLSVLPDATQFVAIEAKLFAPLSATVTNAPFYDQASRTVACMAEVLRRAGRCPQNLGWLGFYVIAPRLQIERGIFNEQLEKNHIQMTIVRRIAQYGNEPAFAELQDWKARWVDPLVDLCEIACLSWEDSIERIRAFAPDTAASLQEFYELCKTFNAPPVRQIEPEPRQCAQGHNRELPQQAPAGAPKQYADYQGSVRNECNAALQAQLLRDLRRFCRWDTNSMTVGRPGAKPFRVWNTNGRSGEIIDICDRGLENDLIAAGLAVNNHRIQFPAEVDQEFITSIIEALVVLLD